MGRNYIKAMAASRGEKLQDVAAIIGVSQTTLSAIIGGAGISTDVAKKIADWHGNIAPWDVLVGTER